MRILQLLEWNLKDITKELKSIKEQGFDYIQISPIQPLKEETFNWWSLYQPCGFSIGNYWIGSKEDLIELCDEANKYDLKITVDIICNHMAGGNNGNIIEPHENVDPKLVENKYFWKERRSITNWDSRYEQIHYCLGGLPGLDLSNYDLQDIIIDFLNELVDCGVSGFRFDAAKNIALPEEGCDFWNRVLNSIKNKDKLLLYAELIFCPKDMVDKYCKYINVLTDSIGSDRSKMITFIESHDSYLDDVIGYTKKMSNDRVISEYGILCSVYDNTLFYNRPFSNMYKDNRIRNSNYQ